MNVLILLEQILHLVTIPLTFVVIMIQIVYSKFK